MVSHLLQNISGWIRGKDSSRFLHYEGGGSRTSSTDIVCPMYMRIWDIVKIAEDPAEIRPLILCEYVFELSLVLISGNITNFHPKSYLQFELLKKA